MHPRQKLRGFEISSAKRVRFYWWPHKVYEIICDSSMQSKCDWYNDDVTVGANILFKKRYVLI